MIRYHIRMSRKPLLETAEVVVLVIGAVIFFLAFSQSAG